MRNHLSTRDRQYIGTYCCNCGTAENINYHHIVPLSLGGNDILTNLCCLCEDCHSMLHIGRKRGNLSAATKAGLARAKERGVQLGNKTGTHFTTKKSIKAKAIIINESKDFYGESSDTSVMISCGVSRNTYYKYKNELKEEIAKGIDVRDRYSYKEVEEQTAPSIPTSHSYHFDHLYNY